MPAHTKAAIDVLQKFFNNEREAIPQHILNYYPIYKSDGQFKIAVLAKINTTFDKLNAIEKGFEVGAIIGSIASMRIPVQFLDENFSFTGIEYIEVAEKLSPELDRALIDTRANLVHQGIGLPQSYTGRDVIIGVVDWGFDYTHPTFFDTLLTQNRILAAWDQEKKIGIPAPGFSHGSYYSNTAELAIAESDTFSQVTDYHGTHVAGIAGGSGGGTNYRGVGFESQFLFSQMRRDVSSSLDAFQWMYNEAQTAGKRLVINNSWGGYRTQPLDGTSLTSQAIDALSEQGVIFVFSAGNNGDINFHLKKTFTDDSIRTRVMGFNYNSDHELWGQTVSMWGEVGHPFSAKLRILSATNIIVGETELIHTATSPALTDTFLIIGADTVFYNFIVDAAHPLNGRPQMTLNVKSENQTLKQTIYATAQSGTVHFWNTRLTEYGGGNWGYGFTAPTAGYVNGDKNYGIGHPAVTSSVITVAAHETNNLLTAFSSYGPRMDEVLKPEISAPGKDIISAFSSFSEDGFVPAGEVVFNGKKYEFIRLSGTSMSAPMVSGAVALLLEADPDLAPSQVKQILLDYARNDSLTGEIGPDGHVRWGYGKLDIHEAILSLLSSGNKDISEHENKLFPNPARDILYVDGQFSGKEIYNLYNSNGAHISTGIFNGSISLTNLASGMYVMKIEGSGGVESYRVVVE